MRAFSLLIAMIFSGLATMATAASVDTTNARMWYGFNPLRLVTPTVSFNRFIGSPLAVDSCALIQVQVGKDGSVQSAKPLFSQGAQDSSLTKVCDSIRFDHLTPWTAESDEITLVIRLCLSPSSQWIQVGAPVTVERIPDCDLLRQSLVLNGKILPQVQSFPSYYPSPVSPDSLKILPIALVRIGIRENGQVASSQLVFATQANLGYQTEAAALRATFAESGITRAYRDSIYLAILGLKSGQSPTLAWKAQDSVAWFGCQRAWVLPGVPRGTDLLVPPLPKGDYRHLSYPELSRLGYVLTVRCAVDSSGQTRFFPDRSLPRPLRAQLTRLLEIVHFFPALRVNGTSMDWRGELVVQGNDDGSLRVQPSWLSRK